MRELVRFGRMFLADGVAEDGTRVLPGGTFAAMREPQVRLPEVGALLPYAWGLGLMFFDWDGVAVVGHDGNTVGQRTCWRVVPGHDVVVAVTTNGGDAVALIDDVLSAVLAEVTGMSVPARPTPPVTATASPEISGRHASAEISGRYASPTVTLEVEPVGGGLAVTVTPEGAAREIEGEASTARYLPLGPPGVFIGVEKDEGVHPVIAFLADGRLLHNLRTVPPA